MMMVYRLLIHALLAEHLRAQQQQHRGLVIDVKAREIDVEARGPRGA